MKPWDSETDPATIPDGVLQSEVGRRRNAKRMTHGGGRPPTMKRCAACGREMTSTELRRHARACVPRPA